jgi:hypothetical protein
MLRVRARTVWGNPQSDVSTLAVTKYWKSVLSQIAGRGEIALVRVRERVIEAKTRTCSRLAGGRNQKLWDLAGKPLILARAGHYDLHRARQRVQNGVRSGVRTSGGRRG